MGSEKFCLRWNDFECSISGAFKELRNDKDFFDVTIACDDEQLQAHKVILGACSQFFRKILQRNPHQHPLLYLKGVRFTDLQYVLNFMYNGEVNVAQDELNSFLAVAEDLKVKGLTQNETSQPQVTTRKRSQLTTSPEMLAKDSEPSQNLKPKSRLQTHSRDFSSGHHQEQDIQEVNLVKTEPAASPSQNSYTIERESYAYHPSASSLEESQIALHDESYDEYEDYSDANILDSSVLPEIPDGKQNFFNKSYCA